jgi:hypothetical protein
MLRGTPTSLTFVQLAHSSLRYIINLVQKRLSSTKKGHY